MQEAKDDTDISKREKARLREMQRMKKQKLQEILDAQNAAIDADMVGLCVAMLLLMHWVSLMCYVMIIFICC